MSGPESTFSPQPFPETNWSLIHLCQDGGQGASLRTSLDVLFRKYWSPVYFYIVRYWTRDPEEAKDLTQAFFLSFLERDFLRSVEADRGRFRTFVCTALRHFLSNEKRYRRARKRHPGPGRGLLSIEGLQDRDSRFDIPHAEEDDRDLVFKQDWKRATIRAALDIVRDKARAKGKEVLVDLMVAYDLEPPPEGKPTYQAMAEASDLSVSQVTNGLRWARQEFVAALKQEIADQVASGEDLREEALELFGMSIAG